MLFVKYFTEHCMLEYNNYQIRLLDEVGQPNLDYSIRVVLKLIIAILYSKF